MCRWPQTNSASSHDMQKYSGVELLHEDVAKAHWTGFSLKNFEACNGSQWLYTEEATSRNKMETQVTVGAPCKPSSTALRYPCAALSWDDAFRFDSTAPVRKITFLRPVVISEAYSVCVLFRWSLRHLRESAQYHLLAIAVNSFRAPLIDVTDATILHKTSS